MWWCGTAHIPTYNGPPLAVDLFSVDSYLVLPDIFISRGILWNCNHDIFEHHNAVKSDND
jgi:hypothetical protein